MTRGISHALSALILVGSLMSGCGVASCDSAMRFSTLELDLSAFPNASELELEVACLDRADQDACTEYPAGHRYSVAKDNAVFMWIGVRAVRLFVYKKASQEVVVGKILDPIPWDPPPVKGPCGPPQSHATWKL